MDTQTRVPAGWYADPGQSGGKRWWDGTKWTEHLKAPEVVAPKATPAQPGPYGLATGGSTGYLQVGFQAAVAEPEQLANNREGWLSLLFGVLAIAATVATFLPGSIVFWVAGTAIVALVLGARSLSHRSKQLSTILWAPLVGMIFAVAATIMALLGFNLSTVITTATSGLLPSTPTTTQAFAIQTSPEPFVFPSNGPLTDDGTTVQQLATSINRAYASGNSNLGADQGWPQLKEPAGTKLVSKDGLLSVSLPAGENFTYRLSSDHKSYTLTVASGDLTEVAIYYSATDQFTFNCPVADKNCVPAH